MKQTYKFTIPIAALALIATGAVGAYAYQSHAQTTTQNNTTQSQTAHTNRISSLIQTIAQKFNLNQSDVQQVFDDQKTQMEAEHQQREADRLSQAVTDGKLTQDQADKISAKEKELEANRHAAIQQQITDLKQWATDNGIPQEFMPFGGPGGHRGGPGMFGHMGQNK